VLARSRLALSSALARSAARPTRWTDLEVRDYAELLHLAENYAVMEIFVEPGDWTANHTIAGAAPAQASRRRGSASRQKGFHAAEEALTLAFGLLRLALRAELGVPRGPANAFLRLALGFTPCASCSVIEPRHSSSSSSIELRPLYPRRPFRMPGSAPARACRSQQPQKAWMRGLPERVVSRRCGTRRRRVLDHR
jgi:hypothetical protein